MSQPSLVGLRFNIKMLEAYLVLPALVLIYLHGVTDGWKTRLDHLAIAISCCSQFRFRGLRPFLTPASQRPYVG